MIEEKRNMSERIRELREILNLTEEEMARETGVDIQKYIEYETSGEDIPLSVLYHPSLTSGVSIRVLIVGHSGNACSI
jgi:transcriptional regulator with XRE-family HTH domain